MTIRLYMDVHVPLAITEQLRRRAVDVLTATEDGYADLPDDELLERANQLGRVLFTQDIRFKAMAQEWTRSGRVFAGLIFGHQLHGTIGQYVESLDLAAKETSLEEWENLVEHFPI